MSDLQVLEWFRDAPLPLIVPDPALVLTGTTGLASFADAASRCGEAGQLSIASAFIDEEVGDELRVLSELRHRRIDVSVVTSSDDDAARVATVLDAYPWRSLEVRVLRGLHAKVYAFLGECRASVCLIGSHNLTVGGARRNTEAGVLFVSFRPSFVRAIASACCEHVGEIGRAATLHHDSMKFTQGFTTR